MATKAKEEKKVAEIPQPTEEERQRAIAALVGRLQDENTQMRDALRKQSEDKSASLMQAKLSWLWSIIMAASEENIHLTLDDKFVEYCGESFKDLLGKFLKME